MESMPADLELYPGIEIVYDELPGWEENLSDIKKFEDLPANCKAYVAYIENKLGVKAAIISTGPKRDQTIIVEDLF